MDAKEKEIFQKNFVWFNHFFDDLGQLLEEISNNLAGKLKLATSNKNWYYPKSNYQPTIPSYYVTALSNKEFVVQVYAILDTDLIKDQTAFNPEPSLIIVKHSRVDRVLYLEEYGLLVIRNKQITKAQINEKVISGEILAGDGKGTKFFAFQVSLDHFTAGKNINAAINTEIIDILRELPDWTGKKNLPVDIMEFYDEYLDPEEGTKMILPLHHDPTRGVLLAKYRGRCKIYSDAVFVFDYALIDPLTTNSLWQDVQKYKNVTIEPARECSTVPMSEFKN